MTKRPSTGFQVQVRVNETGLYTGYSSLKRPESREMAESLAAWLKKSGCGGRIVDLSNDKVIEQWETTAPVKPLPKFKRLYEIHGQHDQARDATKGKQ
jgi:hypothetical protein